MKLFEKKIKKSLDNIIENALQDFAIKYSLKDFEDFDICNKFIEQNKELLAKIKDVSEKYNKNILDGNAERTAMAMLKLQYESRIHELEAENRKLKEQLYSCGNDKQKLIDEINNLDNKIKELSK